MAHLSASAEGGAASAGEPLVGDASVLRGSVSIGELRRYRRASGAPWWATATLLAIGLVVAVAAILALVIYLLPMLTGPQMHPMAALVVAGAPAIWLILLISGYAWWLKWRLRDVKLWRFARLNGFEFRDRIDSAAGWNRVRIGTGFPRNMRNIERATIGARIRGSSATLGRNTVTAKRGDDRANIRRPFAFGQLELPREVPHIILKNKRSRVLSLMGLGLGNRTKLSLEGDFDRHFTLLCPEGYERDALEIFTPDVMAAVIDAAGSCEVELIDDKLFLYFRFSTPLWRAETMDRVQRALALLRERFELQAARYSDDRGEMLAQRAGIGDAATAGSVSLSGRRMTSDTGVSAATVLLTAAVILTSAVITVLSLFVFPQLHLPDSMADIFTMFGE